MAVAAREREVRHDVMAHIHEFGARCPQAAGIIHLGATSCYVTDNADLILYRDALNLLEGQIKAVLCALSDFARRYRDLATPGYTHFQPAQPVTVGKRACLWMQDLMLDLEELQDVRQGLRFLGCRGTTGTEASFLELFDGDTQKIDQMNAMLAQAFGFDACYPVCGQTYPRKADSRILALLSSIAQSAYRFAGDIRLLQHEGQIEEPFADHQVGSSAMAYKRNPMAFRADLRPGPLRHGGRPSNGPMTASAQWFERTLDGFRQPAAFPARGLPGHGRHPAPLLQRGFRPGGAPGCDPPGHGGIPALCRHGKPPDGSRNAGGRPSSPARGDPGPIPWPLAAAVKEGQPNDLLQRLADDPAFPLSARTWRPSWTRPPFVGRAPGAGWTPSWPAFSPCWKAPRDMGGHHPITAPSRSRRKTGAKALPLAPFPLLTTGAFARIRIPAPCISFLRGTYMAFHPINLETWPRRGILSAFHKRRALHLFPHHRLDITPLQGRRLYPRPALAADENGQRPGALSHRLYPGNRPGDLRPHAPFLYGLPQGFGNLLLHLDPLAGQLSRLSPGL